MLCMGFFSFANGQTNKEIANVYIKRAKNSIALHIDYKQAEVFFKKAMKYMDTITSPEVAKLGSYIYYELEDYKQAKKLSKQFFLVNKNRGKNSVEYQEQLELAVSIDEQLEIQVAKEKKLEEERLKKEKAQKRLDSLKVAWNKKSENLTLKVDTIFSFDKNNFAVFKNKQSLGILDDRGQIFIKPTEFTDYIQYDGFILLLNKASKATKIFCFNTNTKIGYLLPIPSQFNTLSTHYGKIMLPRANGTLVTYPNNSYKPLVFDLKQRQFLEITNREELFKKLKKESKIDKYNKDGEVKIDKTWYKFGAHLGGGIYTLASIETNDLQFFLCSIDGNLLSTEATYKYLGGFYNFKLQGIQGDTMGWINQNGTIVEAAQNESGTYSGLSKVVRLQKGNYQIMQNDFIVLENEKLETLDAYLKRNEK